MQNALEVYLGTITALIENGDLEEALNALRKLENDFQIGLGQDVTLQFSAYNRSKKMFQQGLLDNKEFIQQTNKTGYNITELLKEAPRKIQLNAQLKGLSSGSAIQVLTGRVQLEKIIGDNGLVKINWLEKALKASKSVCRIVFADGKAEGTGFLTEGNYIFTNNHVIDSREKAKGMRAQFNFEFGLDNQVREISQYEFDTAEFVTSPFSELDFTRIKLKDRADKPLSMWGVVTLAPQAVPALNDPINIIQHPDGRDKEIALRANEVVKVEGRLLHYLADTEGGSSGSPIFNQAWQVVALHHGARNLMLNGVNRPANEGILFRDIFQQLNGQQGSGATPANTAVAENHRSAAAAPVIQESTQINTPKTPKFLVLYDEADEKYSEILNDHLTPLKRRGKIVVRNLHSDLGAGDPLEFAQAEVTDTDYVLCLITRNFISSNWVDFAITSGKKMIPLRVTSVDIKETGLEKFMTLPSQGRTVPAFGDEDAAYADIVKGLSKLVQ